MNDETPHPDAGAGDSGQPQQKIVVDDPEDYAKTRQLQAIYDARDGFIKSREEVEDMGRTKAAAHVFRRLQDYLLAVEPLLRSSERGRELLKEETYSLDGRFVAKHDIVSFEEAKAPLKRSAREALGGRLTTADVKQLLHRLGLELPDAKIERTVKQLHGRQQTVADGGVSLDSGRASSLLDRHSSDPKRLNVKRLQADIEQLATAERDSTPTGAQAEALIDLIFEAASDLTFDKKKEFKHQARAAATDWGWEVQGVRSLMGETPTLAFRQKHGNGFETTPPPAFVSNEVFIDVQGLMNDLGLGVSFNETQQTKIDDDLLEEVEQWRQMKGN